MTTQIPTPEQLTQRVRGALRAVLGPDLDTVADSDELRDKLGDLYDSLRAVECITRIEEEFGIEVDYVGHDVRYEFATPERIVRFVQWQLQDLAAINGVTAHDS
ncbi:acyl carrier protein [Nocardia aurantiaca]|uniref:Acyl carrier protein n=1 Tax=Nocardia aurantiaca TaxID=2675850 RepID=A0A6I3L545_9NOCA|nr:acyl carrier protein [Nocardia aurantiaca]MTE15655.1 acyl carrier protein [Nocardia aurantiaca]